MSFIRKPNPGGCALIVIAALLMVASVVVFEVSVRPYFEVLDQEVR